MPFAQNPSIWPSFERLRRGQPEIGAGPPGAQYRGDPHPVALETDAGFGQQPAKPHLDPGCRADAASLDDADIAAPGAEIGPHDEKPVHAPGLRAEELGALPTRERRPAPNASLGFGRTSLFGYRPASEASSRAISAVTLGQASNVAEAGE
jgi:hypothetical protein